MINVSQTITGTQTRAVNVSRMRIPDDDAYTNFYKPRNVLKEDWKARKA